LSFSTSFHCCICLILLMMCIYYIYYLFFFFFFFSSRRRHTRSKRDWSSDVCSSDLISLLTSDRDFLFKSLNAAIPATTTPPIMIAPEITCPHSYQTCGFLNRAEKLVISARPLRIV